MCEFCGSTFRVEIDHIDGWALTHKTEIDDLSFKCWHCHDAKTRLGLEETGPPGDRRFLNADGTPWRRPVDHRVDRPAQEAGPAPPRGPTDEPVQVDLFTLAH